MAVVTISRELGSLGTVIAEMLSSRLGYCRVDKKSLEVLLKKFGMTSPQFERDDEKRPGFWEQFSREKVRYLDFMKAAMYQLAAEKDCVIIGRGAHIIFRGVPGTLKLRVIAPLKVRAARLRERFSVDEQHALRLIRQSDHDRAGFHKFFFNASWDSSADYDLVVNTAGISPEETCDAVAALLRSAASSESADLAREVLQDLRIAQDVVIAILYREHAPVVYLEVVCDKGVTALDGTARSQDAIDQCIRIAGTVEGVVKVVNNMAVVEYPLYAGF